MNNIVIQARDFAAKKHEGQLDDSGKPYMVHPEQVANILQSIGMDASLVAAGYLHDTIEDTDTTYEELVDNFGKEIADLVNEVSHEGQKDSRGFYFPRLKTQRGIVLKFADRLSNLSRMEAWSEERRNHYLRKSKFWRSF